MDGSCDNNNENWQTASIKRELIFSCFCTFIYLFDQKMGFNKIEWLTVYLRGISTY